MAGRPLDKYGKKQQKEWLDNILPDLNPRTAGNKNRKSTVSLVNKKLCLINPRI